MIFHSYDPVTGEYNGTGIADPDPVVEGSFLIPAHATTETPPEREAGCAIVWDGTSWAQVEDRRGETWWINNQPVVVSFLGDPSEEGYSPARAFTLSDAQRDALAAVEAKLATLTAAGWSHDFGGTYGVQVLQTRDGDDRMNWLTSLTGYRARMDAGEGAVEGAVFRTASNTLITMSYGDAYALLLEMVAWGESLYRTSWALKDAIRAATTVEEVSAVDINSGW